MTSIPLTNDICPACLGTGKIVDRIALGRQLRALREQAGISLQEMSWRLRTSTARISYMETGKRPWTPRIMNAFIAECEKGH